MSSILSFACRRAVALSTSCLLLFVVPRPAAAQTEKAAPPGEAEGESEDEPEEPDAGAPVEVHYDGGLRLRARDGAFSARIRFRVQSRASSVWIDDLPTEGDGSDGSAGFEVRRARFKLDGHAYRPWLGYYLEYGIASNVLLTWQFDLGSDERLIVRIGQYKVLYNRERVDSSGAQQFADRSIVTFPFTLDRQTGPTVMGRLFAGTRVDSSYAAGVFTGTGRGGGLDDDHDLMYIGRWQWNFLKRPLGYSQSDIARRKDPAGTIAFAAAAATGPFTRFSTSGGGQLPGFAAGEPGQYSLAQWMAELAYHGRGLSLQAEYHFKRIEDRLRGSETELDGWYAQAGYFFHEILDGFPDPLELAIRLARVDSLEGVPQPADRELTLGGNWFMNGHDNKITFDASYLESTLLSGPGETSWRLRLQWDVSF